MKICFDLDGTLYDARFPYYRTLKEVFPQIAGQWLEFYRLHRLYSDKLFTDKQGLHQMRNKRTILTMRDMGYTITETEAEHFQKTYEYYQAHLELDPDMERFLQQLTANNIPLFVLTNGPDAHQRMKAEGMGLFRYIPSEHFYTSEQLGCSKPDLNAFRMVEQYENDTDIWFFGDSWNNDITGGLEAGWKTVWINLNEEQKSDKRLYVCATSRKEAIQSFLQKYGGNL
ncbi:MAG: HAD family hydrolase [Erysipelotrichaceae bacterium]|nr:HAD family hydrolase [Erysipelotrichaceae bacterium]